MIYMNFINSVTNDSLYSSINFTEFSTSSQFPGNSDFTTVKWPKNYALRDTFLLNNNILRVDFLFSYWIFAWFLLYYSSKHLYIIPKIFSWINPIIALYIALIENILQIFAVSKFTGDRSEAEIVGKLSFDVFFKYVAMLLCVKVLPIYLLYNSKIHWYRDIFGTITIFMIYLAWLNYNNTTLWDVYSKVIHSFMRGDNKTPFFALLQWILPP